MEEASLSSMSIALRLGLVALLVAANGFFVAAEFSLVGARRTHIEALARKGNRRAKMTQNALLHLDHYISATQLGITISSLALGWVGETTLAAMIIGIFAPLGTPWDLVASHLVAGTIAFTTISFLHIVLGELAPKSIALLYPEATSMWLAAPLIAFSKLFAPFIIVLNGTANLLLKLIGLRKPEEFERVHRPEEIALLVKQMREHKQLQNEPADIISAALSLSKRTASDVMTSRTRIIAVSDTTPLDQVANVILQRDLSRLPVYHEDLDHIVGMVLAHDVWRATRDQRQPGLAALLRPVFFVPDTKSVEEMIGEMQSKATHLAIVLDEFGGTAGLATLEDLLEEVVGEIRDETEVEAQPIRKLADQSYEIQGNVSLLELNEQFALGLDTAHYTTVGGLVMGNLGRVAEVGDELAIGDLRLRVTRMSGRRIETLSLSMTTNGG